VDTSDYPHYSQNCLATAGVDFDIKALAVTSDSLTTGSPSQRKAALHVLLIQAYERIIIEDFNARRQGEKLQAGLPYFRCRVWHILRVDRLQGICSWEYGGSGGPILTP
jgi:hypothetical protein